MLLRRFRSLRWFSSGGAGSRRNALNVANYPIDVQTSSSEPATAALEQTDTLPVVDASAQLVDTISGIPRLSNVDYNRVNRVRCYNCGQLGHLSYHCQIPQVHKACYQCGNSGHVARDCTMKKRTAFCYHCRVVGHLTSDCPNHQSTQ